ncbi:DUF3592 domain-containing protein [Bernardetia sp. ABR2-2B]|uniref:DUF3592 domain-containing protein n=1 Tax=Bernardetia sp. ABR2-2B TaxID=3127472 RepID=UPI0030D52FF6
MILRYFFILMFSCVTIYLSFKVVSTQPRNTITQGVVKTFEKSVGGKASYSIEFLDAEGERFVIDNVVQSNINIPSFRKGDKVEVAYNKQEPQEGRLNDISEKYADETYAFLFFLFTIFAIVGAIKARKINAEEKIRKKKEQDELYIP